jgi:uncharacterized integral membrane protein
MDAGVRMKKLNYKKIISLVLAALTILFILQNIAVININFLFWTFAQQPETEMTSTESRATLL